jgi:hypothetical protein
VAGNFPQVVSAPISQELELPDQPLPVEPATVSRELELTDQPVEPLNSDLALGDAPPINSPRRLPFIDPFDPYDFERNHWAESSPNELVQRFGNLLVEEELNQWNTECTGAKPYSSATSSPESYPSETMADAGPSNYGRRQGSAQPARSAETEGNNPSQFFKPSTHFTMRDGSQYPYTPYVPPQARPTPTQTLQTENEQLRKAIEAERQLQKAAEARQQQRTRATPAQFQPEDRLEGLRKSRHAPTTSQEDDRHVQRTPQVQLPQQPMPQGFEQPQYAPATEDVRPGQPAVQQDY